MNRNSRANDLQWRKAARKRVREAAETDKPVSFVRAYADARAGLKYS